MKVDGFEVLAASDAISAFGHAKYNDLDFQKVSSFAVVRREYDGAESIVASKFYSFAAAQNWIDFRLVREAFDFIEASEHEVSSIPFTSRKYSVIHSGTYITVHRPESYEPDDE